MLIDNFAWKPFKSDRRMDVDAVLDLFKDKQRQLAQLKEEGKKKTERESKYSTELGRQSKPEKKTSSRLSTFNRVKGISVV